MQWLSPMSTEENAASDSAAIFAEALRQQLLPQENFFELRDFLIFSEMELSTQLLPAKDVEDCIRAIKARTPELNPSRAEDREKLAHEISRFFVDPGRQYKASLEEQREALGALTEEFREHKAHAETEVENLKQEMAVKDTTTVSYTHLDVYKRQEIH